MRVDKLELTNFRCFERRSFEFSPGMNVLIGRNGTGKTAILEALSIVVGPFLERVGGDRLIFLNQARLVPFWKAGDLTLEPQYPVEISSSGILGPNAWRSKRVMRPFPPSDPGSLETSDDEGAQLAQGAIELTKAVSQGEEVDLPLIAYFGTDRLWRRSSDAEPVEVLGPGSRLRGYTDSLRPSSSFRQLAGWFKRMEWVKFQDGAAPPTYDAVRAAIAQCLQGWDEVLYHARLDDLVARTADGSHALPFHMLSDGVRNMIGVVGEIAYRAALLNPHLGADAAKRTPGIVLIDELDLHLHPSWQRRVVEDLRRTFPEMQFFGTTHSPIIVQSLRPGELIPLDDRTPSDYEHRSVEEILEGEMGVPDVQRSKRWHEMRDAAAEYYRTLRQANGASAEEVARLKARLDDLIRPFSDNPAYVALLDMKREAAGLGDSGP